MLKMLIEESKVGMWKTRWCRWLRGNLYHIHRIRNDVVSMFTANSTPWRSAAAPNRILTHDPKRNHVHLKFRNPKERQQGRPSSDLGGSPFVLCASAAKSLENGTLSIMMIQSWLRGDWVADSFINLWFGRSDS